MRQPILFITRNYPPKTGGLENYSYSLIREFEQTHTVFKVTSSLSNRHLLWFLPWCLIRGLFLVLRHSIRHIHLCDGVLAPVGLIVKWATGARVSISIHGLDMTYTNRIYQNVIPGCVGRLDRVFCVSRATRDECTKRGIPAEMSLVVPNGIHPDEFVRLPDTEKLREAASSRLGRSLGSRKVLVTVGRLVPRKGVAWFVSHVMPGLNLEYFYLIVGEGPEKTAIQEAIKSHSLDERVGLTGAVSDDVRNMILNIADVFIMPNIRISSDPEGFGIVALEAGCFGLPVVASDIQGIKDAVIDGVTGYLVLERDAGAFREKIENMNLDRTAIRQEVGRRFDWHHIAARYADAIFSDAGQA